MRNKRSQKFIDLVRVVNEERLRLNLSFRSTLIELMIAHNEWIAGGRKLDLSGVYERAGPPEKKYFERVIDQVFIDALARTGGNQSHAAKYLGVSRATVMSRAKGIKSREKK